jgi:hypothetical protein
MNRGVKLPLMSANLPEQLVGLPSRVTSPIPSAAGDELVPESVIYRSLDTRDSRRDNEVAVLANILKIKKDMGK